MDQDEEILKQTVIEEEKPEMTLADRLREKKRLQKKKNIKYTFIFVFVAFFAYALWFLFKPFKASAEYGICRSFLELSIPYPHTLYVSEIKDLPNNMGLRLWYSHTDGFGEFRMDKFVCLFERDAQTGDLKLADIRLTDKIRMERNELEHLNYALIYFKENPLILNYPLPLPDSLADLHFDFDLFRRVRINSDKYKGP